MFVYFSTELTILLLLLVATLAFLTNIKANTPTDTQLQSSCNSCCQGPAGSQGTPGIPGVPGTNGMPGGYGPKGERGESIVGERGLKGDTGSPGLKGDHGLKGDSGVQGLRGLPGKVGPKGIIGPIGPKGLPGNNIKGDKGDAIKGAIGPQGIQGEPGSPGLKGDKGMVGLPGPQGVAGLIGPKGVPGYTIKGDKGDSIKGDIGPVGIAGPIGPPGERGVEGQKGEMGQTRLSAFSAARSNDFTLSSSGQALPFEILHTNVGNDFDAEAGRFTCEIPGIYLFTYSIGTYRSNPVVFLMKNDNKINSISRHNENLIDITSNAAVLQLAAGDQVWLKCYDSGKIIYSNSNSYTTFSGVILHEI